jgi:hypothetical protein
LKSMRKRLSYANVMSSIAVFLVLGGAAVAATQLPKNSVGTKQLKKNAVTSAKVKNGSLQPTDFAQGTLLQGPKGDTGKRGAKGATGATGPIGPQGVPGPTNVVVRTDEALFLENGSQGTIQADCKTGERVVGGGATSDQPEMNIYASGPTAGGGDTLAVDGNTPTGWLASYKDNSGVDDPFDSVTVYVLCASP